MLLAWFGVALAAEVAAGSSVADRVAASVNDQVVLLSEVYALGDAYIADQVRTDGEAARVGAERAVLDNLIDRALVDQEVRRLQLEVTDAELDRAIDDTARRNGLDRDGLRAELEKQSLPWDTYRDEMRESLKEYKFGQYVLRPRVTITDDELRDAWLREGHAGETEARVLAIVLAAPTTLLPEQRAQVDTLAREIAAKVDGGADFAELARQYDQAGYAEHGGEMGRFLPGQLRGPLDTAVFSGPVGKAQVVELGDAVFVLEVTSRQSATADFESNKGRLADQIFETRMEAEKDRWSLQARRQATIKILLPAGP